MGEFTEMQLRDVSNRAADRAVSKTLEKLGVNPDDPEQIEDLKETLAYAKRIKKWQDLGIKAFVWAFFSGLAGGFMLIVLEGIKSVLRIKGGGV